MKKLSEISKKIAKTIRTVGTYNIIYIMYFLVVGICLFGTESMAKIREDAFLIAISLFVPVFFLTVMLKIEYFEE